MIEVVFVYDDKARLWQPVVRGAATETEAKQAFSAVVHTVMLLDTRLLGHTRTRVDKNEVKIIPAVVKTNETNSK